jgi:small-conductance mechanosensitive channel
MADARDIIVVMFLLAAIGLAGWMASRGLERLLGLSRGSAPRRETPFLVAARAAFPRLRAAVWALVLVGLVAVAITGLGLRLAAAVGVPLLIGLGLALRQPLSNAVAGVLAAIEGSFRVGDRLEIGDLSGVVRSIGLTHVEIRTDDHRELRIPNARLAEVEYRVSSGLGTAVAVDVLLPPRAGEALTVAKRRAFESAATSCYASPRRRPEVYVEQGPSGPLLRVRAYTFDPRYVKALESEVTERYL